jgi:hypothetical protein
MPKGPQGQKRPADVIGNAVHVMRIATGEAKEALPKTKRAQGGKIGGKVRAQRLTDEQRSEIAHTAASARWKKKTYTFWIIAFRSMLGSGSCVCAKS